MATVKLKSFDIAGFNAVNRLDNAVTSRIGHHTAICDRLACCQQLVKAQCWSGAVDAHPKNVSQESGSGPLISVNKANHRIYFNSRAKSGGFGPMEAVNRAIHRIPNMGSANSHRCKSHAALRPEMPAPTTATRCFKGPEPSIALQMIEFNAGMLAFNR